MTTAETFTLHVTTTPSNADAPITYTSSDETVATVEKKDGHNKQVLVTALAEGTATLTATCGEVTETIEVTVTDTDENTDENV